MTRPNASPRRQTPRPPINSVRPFTPWNSTVPRSGNTRLASPPAGRADSCWTVAASGSCGAAKAARPVAMSETRTIAAMAPLRTTREQNVSDMLLLGSLAALSRRTQKLRILINLSGRIQARVQPSPDGRRDGGPPGGALDAKVADPVVAAAGLHAARKRHPAGQEDADPLLHRHVRKGGLVTGADH